MVDYTTGLNSQAVQQMAGTGMNAMWILVLWMIVIFSIIGIIWFIIWFKSFKIKFRIWIVTDTKSLCVDDVAKLIVKKGQAPKWKLRGRKHFVPVPNEDCISINKKGKMVVEAYYSENGQYIFKPNINSPILDINNPLTTIDKEFYLNEHIDAVQKYKKTSIMDLILQLAPMFAIILIFILLLAFWGEIVQPFKEVGQQIIAERQEERLFLEEMHDIHRVIVGNNSNSIYANNQNNYLTNLVKPPN
jgi:hypothetical protein